MLFLQLLNPSPDTFAFFPYTAQLLHQLSDAAHRVERLERQIIISTNPGLLSSPSLEGPILLGFTPVNKYVLGISY